MSRLKPDTTDYQCVISKWCQTQEIAFMTSHEVRVPLANILGLTEVLDLDDPLSSSNLKVIEYIKTSAKELDIKIRNMVQQTAMLDE